MSSDSQTCQQGTQQGTHKLPLGKALPVGNGHFFLEGTVHDVQWVGNHADRTAQQAARPASRLFSALWTGVDLSPNRGR